MAIQLLEEGLDPTPLACISKADVLQMIRAAKPYTANGLGLVIYADAAPDVVTTPALQKSVWVKTVSNVPKNPAELYLYNGTSWTLVGLVDGAQLAANSVPLTKLSLTGSSPLFIMQMNAGGTAIVWTSVINAIQASSITLAKLANNGAGNNSLMASVNGSNAFVTISTALSWLANGGLDILKLTAGNIAKNQMLVSLLGVNQYIDLANIISYIADNSLAVAKLAVGSATATQSIRRNAANTAWEFYTPGASLTVSQLGTNTALLATGGSNGTVQIAHGQSAIPKMVDVRLVCTDPVGEAGYEVDDEIPIHSFFIHSTTDDDWPIAVEIDATYISLHFYVGVDGVLKVIDQANNALTAITTSKWRAKAYGVI